MRRHPVIATSLSAMLLISIASAADARPQYSAPTSAECAAYARTYANESTRRDQIFGGTAIGSLAGFGIGSIWAASGIGAAIGAGVGLVGAIIASTAADDAYAAAYQDCMSRRVR